MSQSSKTLRFGVFDPVYSLDPRQAQDYVSLLVLGQVMEPPFLLRGGSKNPEPLVFSGPMQQEEAGPKPVYSAHVRQGVCFSNGVEMTAQHVEKSLSSVGHLRPKAKVKADGDRVLFFLQHPNARFDLVLTHCNCAIALLDGEDYLGAGPYQVAERTATGGVRLVKNPHYHREVAIDEIEFVPYPRDSDGRPTALVSAISKGRVDFTTLLSRREVTTLRGVRKLFEAGHSTAMLYFNVDREHLAEARLRQAIAMALDRRRIAETSYDRALAYTASSVLPPDFGQARDGLFLDRERAREMLAGSHQLEDSKLRLLSTWGPRPYLPNPDGVANEIVEQLAAVGLEVVVEVPNSPEAYWRSVRAGDYDLVLAGWIADTPDPAEFFEALFASWSVPGPDNPLANTANMSRWKSSAMDRLLADYRDSGTDAARNAVLALIKEQVPVVPLMYGPSIVVHGMRVRNYQSSSLGLPRLSDLDLS